MVVALVVNIELNEGHRDEWFKHFTPIVEQVKLHEPNTLTYKLYEDPTNPNKFVIFERYVSQADVESHRESKQFQDFAKVAPPMMKVFIINSFNETDTGFIERK